jgi:hypothetical protein
MSKHDWKRGYEDAMERKNLSLPSDDNKIGWVDAALAVATGGASLLATGAKLLDDTGPAEDRDYLEGFKLGVANRD